MKGARVVFNKEMLENVRDRRTLFSALLFGPLFGPLLFALVVNVSVSRNLTSVEQDVEVPIVGAAAAPNLVAYLAARGVAARDDVEIEDLDAAAVAVRRGDEELVVHIDEDFASDFGSDRAARVTLIFDRSNAGAGSRVNRVRTALQGYSQQLAALRLLARGLDPNVVRPLSIDDYDVSTAAGRSALLLGMLTYFFLLAMLMGGFYLAIDTTAGERERRSLEPLLTTPVPRAAFALGKLGATIAYMLASLALTFAGFSVALSLMPLEEIGMSTSFGPMKALTAFAIFAPFAPLGAAVMMLVASFTKSYKEAQTYLGIVILVPTVPLIFANIVNLSASQALMWIPSLSQHLLVTALIREEPLELSMLATSAASSLIASIFLVWISVRLYEREALLG
jgi:sodium transport system permease protein